jgi:RNA polymerase sigma factor (sigma-70 family)
MALPPSIQAERCRVFQAGLAARDELVAESLGLVKKIAVRFARTAPGVDLDDLIQEATLAFLDAMRWYRFEKGLFHTYAGVAIKNRLFEYLSRPGNRPLTQESDAETDCDDGGSASGRMLDTIPQPPPRLPDDVAEQLDAALAVLAPTERLIVVMREGLGGASPSLFSDIANAVGLTTAATMKLYKDAIKRLKKHGRRRR